MFCYKAVGQPADVLIHFSLLPRILNPRHSTKTVLWCAHNSKTFIIVETMKLILGITTPALIDHTTASVLQHIRIAGDGVIPASQSTWGDTGGTLMKTWNSNNHQITWGVFGAALSALKEYTNEYGWGTASFTIFDGVKEVGEGYVVSAD